MGKDLRWVAPPNWPDAPEGWSPPAGWTPDPAWGPPPADWVWWQAGERADPPFWKAKTLRDTSPRFRRRLGASFAVLVLLFVVGAVGDDGEPDSITTARAADSEQESTATTAPSPPASRPSPSAAPTAPPAPSTDELIAAAGDDQDSALALLGALAVKGRAAQTGYDRELFGPAWADTDRNGCDTRNDMLGRDLTAVQYKAGTGGCKVLAGTLADPFTGQTIAFSSEAADAVHIDHVVALSDAWQKGAQQWEAGKLLAFANDPLNLLAVDGPANISKSDGDAATWLPPNKAFRCPMVALQVAVKAKYELWVTTAERDAVARVLADCPAQVAPSSDTPTLAPIAPPPAPPAPAPVAPPAQAPAQEAPPVQAPAQEAPAASQGVTPGAFCSPEGATGTGKKNGKAYTCKREPGEDRARWRQ